MRELKRRVAMCAALLVVASPSAAGQDFRGRINGTVTDNTGAVLPGVSVTATSPALIQAQTQVAGVATLQETVTVSGNSPIVATSTTAMGTNVTTELLTEIPHARDIWAAMSQGTRAANDRG